MLAAGGSSLFPPTKADLSMGFLIQSLETVCFIVSLVCFIMVLIKMFQNDQTVLGIVCIVGVCFCCGGKLIAFIVGWMNSTKWGIKNIMLVWTGAIVLFFVLSVIGTLTGAVDIQAQYQQMNKQLNLK
jgi:hypothetical protein